MMKNINIEDFQKLGQHNMDAAMKVFGEWNKGWQAIAAEMTDYDVRQQVERADSFIEQLRCDPCNGCRSCQRIRGRSASRASPDR